MTTNECEVIREHTGLKVQWTEETELKNWRPGISQAAAFLLWPFFFCNVLSARPRLRSDAFERQPLLYDWGCFGRMKKAAI